MFSPTIGDQEERDCAKEDLPTRTTSATLSGASGKFLAAEMRAWLTRRGGGLAGSTQGLRESLELGLAASYDRPFGWFFNFVYDILQLSSGRDKFLALLQGYAKFASAALCKPDSERHWMYRGIEDSLSDGRKTFRLFKEFREVYKIRRGMHRCMEGAREDGVPSIMATCGCTDTLAHIASLIYYLFDNLLWAASVGIVRSKAVPKWQRKMWNGGRKEGPVLTMLGGVASVKGWKNLASIWRLVFAIIGNALLLRRAELLNRLEAFQGPDDPRLFHCLELLGMAANFRILAAKLGYAKLSQKSSGLLAMLAACTGTWSNWRKVCRKKCGTKPFLTELRRTL